MDLQRARENHRATRGVRDGYRLEALEILKDISDSQVIDNEYRSRISILLRESNKVERQSELLFDEVKRVKESHRIRGFDTLNSFLDGIGNPIFILMLGVVFAIFYLYGEQVQWKVVSKLYMLGLTSCVLVSTFYLYWALSPKEELDRKYYLYVLFVAAVVTSFFVSKIVEFLFTRSRKRHQVDEKISNTLDDFVQKIGDKK